MRSFIAKPLRRYLDYKFSAIETRLDALTYAAASGGHALSLIDVRDHNAGMTPPTFDRLVSQVVSAAQFSDPSFERLRSLVYPGTIELAAGEVGVDGIHRKVWEYVYVLKAAEQYGVLAPGRTALGFGVGTEPLPAVLASYGVRVVATDQDRSGDTAGDWSGTGQHMSDLSALSKPEIIADVQLSERVRLEYVDMTAIPGDIGTFDLIWSCCAFEHLGSPEAGLEFVLHTLPLLEPGGISVHTTEFELTRRDETADYGNLVVYRKDDLEEFSTEVRARGFEIETNWYVALETPVDRHVSPPPYAETHLKLFLGESVSTSVGLLIRRPD